MERMRSLLRDAYAVCLCAVAIAGCSSPDEPLTVDAQHRSVASAALTSDAKPLAVDRSTAAPMSGDINAFFPGRSEVAVSDLFAAMSAQADALAASATLRGEYDTLLAKHHLIGSDELYADYLRVRLAFEATRAGGLWGLEWRVTDREPNSEAIWKQWRSLKMADVRNLPKKTAIAECDELSALFAVVARGIGLSQRSQVGLLWPTSNHTVAVWVIGDATPNRRAASSARVVVPTSQIFLDSVQSLNTGAFDPWRQPRIYDYTRKDIAAQASLPAPLARYFLMQTQGYGALSRGELQGMRNRRAYDQRRAAAL
jgi:hypothetical protein